MDTLKWVQNLKKDVSSPLLQVFFHQANYRFLDQQVVARVSQKAKMTVASQAQAAMLGVMVRVYDNFIQSNDLRRDLENINARFVTLATEHILLGLKDYKHYYHAASTLAVPIGNPINASSKGSIVLRNTPNTLH